MPAKTKRDEEKWKKAKSLAKKQGRGEDYAYVMGIYKKMKPDYFKESFREFVRKVLEEDLRKKNIAKLSSSGHVYAILSAYVDEPKSVNKKRHEKLIEEIRSMGYKFYETKAPPWPRIIEKGVVIPGISFNQAVELGQKYSQESIGYKGEDGVVGFYNFKEGKVYVPRSTLETAMPSIAKDRELYSKARGLSFEWDLENAIQVSWDGRTQLHMAQITQNPL